MFPKLTKAPQDCGRPSIQTTRQIANRCALTGIVLSLLALASAQLPCSGRPSPGSNSRPVSPTPEVLVWLDARNQQSDSVSITYASLVSRAEAERDVAQLVQEAGWTIYGAEISEEEPDESDQPPMTSVMLSLAKPAIDAPVGVPVAPIVTALKRFNVMKVVYAAPSGYQFLGPGDFDNKYVNIKLNRGINTYEYTVAVKDSSFGSLDLPLIAEGTETSRGRGAPVSVYVVILAAAAVLVAAVTYLLSARLARRGGNDSLRRS